MLSTLKKFVYPAKTLDQILAPVRNVSAELEAHIEHHDDALQRKSHDICTLKDEIKGHLDVIREARIVHAHLKAFLSEVE